MISAEKTALVFAASRGIGRAVAIQLARDGTQVAVNYVSNAAEAESVVTAIVEAGGRAIAVRGNVADKGDVERAFDQVEAEFGGIDIVVNAAAANAYAPLLNTSEEDLDRLIAVNVKGAFHVLQQAAKRVRDGGRIVQFSTGGTVMPIQTGGIYLGTKAAGELMAMCLAKELGGRGVTVNVVSPGLTRTDGLTIPQEALDKLVMQIPLGRIGEADDVAAVVTFLTSDAGRWMTAQNVRPTGGLV